MKRISGLFGSPDGLLRFIADPLCDQNWDSFGSFETGEAKRELASALVGRQHGLCAYCEIGLIADDIRIEHFVAQSDVGRGANLVFEPGNLLAVCKGGSNRNFGPEAIVPDPARYLPPVRKNLSCDAAKGEKPSDLFLDPRLVPASPPIFKIDDEGGISVDRAACEADGIDEDKAKTHLKELGLDVRRLRVERSAIWQQLLAAFVELAPLGQEAVRAFAESRLLLGHDERLPSFFSTSRSFFGPLAEVILASEPQSWI